MRGLPVVRVEQLLDVECFALEPGFEARRRDQAIHPQREFHPLLRRVEALDVEHAHLVERGLLHGLDDRGEVGALALAPHGVQDRREQDVLAALERVRIDAEQSEQAGNCRANAFLECGGVARGGRVRCGKRAQDRQRTAGVRARRVDRDLGGVAQALDARAVLVPLGESLAPGLGRRSREILDRLALAGRLARVHPGLEVRGLQVRKRQQQVADVALGVDGDGRHAVDGGLLQQRQAQARLAAAGHADADGVGGQVPGVVEQFIAERLGLRVVFPAEVEDAELLVAGEGHGGGGGGDQGVGGRGRVQSVV